ncbi:MAG: V-type ATP synthase subunit A [Thermoplasmata archaeon]|nr:V-type ATP synthase subunit A [Thermoplasmata archaeon]
MSKTGEVQRVAGPVVTAIGISPRMYDVVFVGNDRLMGEVIRISGNKSIIQVYEETTGVCPGEPIEDTGQPLSVELGPGLITSIYDGIQRPLPGIMDLQGTNISRGTSIEGLSRTKTWKFVPAVEKGTSVLPGQSIGTVAETPHLEHKIMIPSAFKPGIISEISEGDFKVDQTIATMDNGQEIQLMQKWPVRIPRPYSEKLMPDIPLITGQRVLDFFFPIAKGGTAAIPGGFGTGKTVTQHQLAKWSDSDVVVYVGCGERGNEMTEVLTEFPELEDQRTGAKLSLRTVLIANTSNMPVAAREASIYTGMTIAEYYRDMGLSISMMADSTSRWAEAMREISSRLEEMPGEEGYPAYLSSKLSEFYERAGRVKTLDHNEGAISVIGAVSPQGGDFSEPVTQGTLRIVKVFWALDTKLREKRHFPAVNWLNSYSLYSETLADWFSQNVARDWPNLVQWAVNTLQREAELQEIVQLVGSDALPDEERLILEVARMIREFFLQQDAFHDIDSYCKIENQYRLMKCIKDFNDRISVALGAGISFDKILGLQSREELSKAKYEDDFDGYLDQVMEHLQMECRLWEESK